MRRFFSYFMVILFVFAWSVNYSADKKDESRINIQKYALKHSTKFVPRNTKDAYFEEGFEGTFPPDGWMNIGMEAQWQQTDAKAHTGTYSAYHNDDNISDTETDTLITPAIDLTGATAPMLTFWQYENYGSWAEFHGVLITADNFVSWDTLYTEIGTSSWEQVTIDLSAYAGSVVNIAFLYTGDYSDEWYIDDIVVDEAPAEPIMSINYTGIDFGLTPVDSVSEYDGFVVKNDGGGTLEFTNISGFDGTDFYTDLDQTITLGPGEADTFAIGFQPLSEGQQNAELIIESNGGTDTISVAGFGIDESDKFVEGFEEDVPPTDWSTNVLSGSYDWEQYQTSSAIDGEYVAKYNSYSASSGSSSELITPRLDLRNYDNPYVAFYFAHPTSASSDSLGVFFSDGDTNWVHVATLLVQDYYWHSYVFYVSDYISNIVDSTNFKVKFVAYSAYGSSMLLDHIILPQVYVSTETVDWCNLQWPPTVDATVGDSVAFYGQVYKAGVTEGEGQGEGIEVWFGGYDQDIDPALWPEDSWEHADYNEFASSGNNDEYMFNALVDLAPGTYYYTFRYRYGSGPYTYGGYSASGGGFWDGVNNVSGVLTVNPLVVSEFPYSEGFESGIFPPVGWSNPDSYWSLGTEAHTGSYCAKVRYNHDGEAILTTPSFELDAQNPMYISFYWKDDDITGKVAGHDTTFFEISNDDGLTWIGLDTLSEETHDSEYHLVMHLLSDYVGQTVMFRWRDVNDGSYSSYGTGVDDITIDYYVEGPGEPTNPNPEDGATDVPLDQIVTWENPSTTFYNVVFASFNDPTSVENMDSTAIVLDGSVDTTVYSEAAPENGFPGETDVYWRVVEYADDGSFTIGPVWSFTTTVDMYPAPTDFWAMNGIGMTKMGWNYVAPPEPNSFFESFENSNELPNGWHAIDNDEDGYNWGVWSLFAHSGANSVASFSYDNNVGALTPDNWLITPAIQLGENSVLSFWAGASDTSWYQEHFQVYVSTEGDSIPAFANQLLDITLTTAEFTEYTVDLTAYANQTVYIAFVHNNVTDQYNLSIDDITVSGIAHGKQIKFAFEDPKDIKQFKLVSVTDNNNILPLKKIDGEDESQFKERLDYTLVKYQKSRHFDSPKGFEHFNIYRDGEQVATAHDTYFEDTTLPEYYTQYGYYVTAVYHDGIESNPSNIDSAMAIDPNDVIFYNDFENGELPPYYTVINANEDDYTWEAFEGYANSGEYSMAIRWNSSMAMDDWVFIGPIQMYGGENYRLRFGYRAASSTWTENMAVFVTNGIDTSSSAVIEELFRQEHFGNTEYEFPTNEFGIPTDGEYYIAFHGYSDPDMYRIAVDDIILLGNGELVGQQDSSIVFADDFENGTGQWELLGGWGLVDNEFVSPTHSLTESPNGNYPDNAVFLATMNDGVDLSNVYDAQIEFMTKYQIEQGFDYMYVDITYDGAKGWTTLAAFDGVVEDWTPIVIPIGGYVGNTGVKVRFRFVSDAGYNMDGMYIDDFVIRVSNEDTTPPLVTMNCPQDYEGVLGDFVVNANITDISGVALANLLYTTVCPEPTPSDIITAEADSVDNNGTFYFHIPEQEPGTLVCYTLVVADNLGNIDTLHLDDAPCEYIAGKYINFDDNEVTFVLNVPQDYMVAKRLTVPDSKEAHIVTALIRNYTDAGRPNGNIMFHIWADNNGVPGEDLITPFEMEPAASLENPYEMTVADLRDVQDSVFIFGDFWVGFSVPGDEVWLTLGRELDDTRSFVYDPTTGQWAMYSREFQFRAIAGELYEPGDVAGNEIPKKFELMQNYPNPFNPTTIIKYALPKEAHVTLKIYNVLGQEVVTLVNKNVDAGYHEVNFNASQLSSGIYIYRIEAGNFVATKKMMLLK